MIKLSEAYTKQNGVFGISVFDIVAESEQELFDFWFQNKDTLVHPQLHEEERVSHRIQFKSENHEAIQNLAYRFNICLQGKEAELDKKNFLRQFASEALQAIIYATDYVPEGMTIDQYVGAVLAAFDKYGDNALFDDRIINIALGDPVRAGNMLKVGQQIEMFKNLLVIPMDHDPLDSDLAEGNGELLEVESD